MTNNEVLKLVKEGASPRLANAMEKEDFLKTLEIDQNVRNEFLDVLLDKVGKMLIESGVYEGKLGIFYKGKMPYGYTLEQVFTNYAESKLINGHFNNGQGDEIKDLVDVLTPDIRVNLKGTEYQYSAKGSISRARMKTAVRDEEGLAKLVESILDSIESAIRIEQEEILTDTIMNNVENKGIATIETMPLDGELTSTRRLGQTVNYIIGQLGCVSSDYNKAHVKTQSKPSDLVFLTTPAVASLLEVNEIKNIPQVTLIHELPQVVKDVTTGVSGSKVLGLVVDKNWLAMYSSYDTMRTFDNADQMATNYFHARHDIVGICDFCNAVAIVSGVTPDGGLFLPEELKQQILA